MLRILGIKLFSRLLLLACSITVFCFLALTHCGINSENYEDISTNAEFSSIMFTTHSTGAFTYQNNLAEDTETSYHGLQQINYLLRQREAENTNEVARLTAEIKRLRLQLLHYKSSEPLFRKVYKSASTSIPAAISILPVPDHVKSALQSSEILHGTPYSNEFEIIAYSHFSSTRVYPVDLGLGKRVVEKPIGAKRTDLSEILLKALDYLNSKIEKDDLKYTTADFVEGLYRVNPLTGTEYALYFRNKNNRLTMGNYTKLTLMRPFVPALAVDEQLLYGNEKQTVHVIVSLAASRIETFQSFIEKFAKIALRHDKHVHLTVVYFGEKGLGEVQSILSRLPIKGNNNNSQSLRLLVRNETFSRSKGSTIAIESLSSKNQDTLVFMCDVDIVFSTRFLDRCRWNAIPGRQIYYPITFSLYNPSIVYTLQGRQIPSEADQLVVSRDTGFWRDFDYTATCQYVSDFNRVKGWKLDESSRTGWDEEDVALYRKYVRSNLKVIRATDPGIFHIWRPKMCSRTEDGQPLTPDQYRACIRSRALSEASHAQLGLLAFSNDGAESKGMTLQKRKNPKS